MSAGSYTHLLKWFAYDHLPAHLQEISDPFGKLAVELADKLPISPQTTSFLERLLEAKDCAVRAAMDRAPLTVPENLLSRLRGQ